MPIQQGVMDAGRLRSIITELKPHPPEFMFQTTSSSYQQSPNHLRCGSHVEERWPVTAERPLHGRHLFVVLSNGDQNQPHHQHHQPNRHQARTEDDGHLSVVAIEEEPTDEIGRASCRERV